MTQGFYEQLAIDPGSTPREIRVAYTRVVQQLIKRRKAIVERGGDPSPLELTRAQVDEAWRVLSDPIRRRRYDAMRAYYQEGGAADTQELWRRIAGALIHPAAGAAAELLRVTTNLKVGALPPIPRFHPDYADNTAPFAQRGRSVPAITAERSSPSVSLRPVPSLGATKFQRADSDDVTQHLGTVGPSATMADPRSTPSGVRAPSRGEAPVEFGARTSESRPSAPVVMPAASRRRTLSAEDVARLVDRFGYTGALLRAVRDAKEISLQEMSDTTRISVKYLEAIEGDRFDLLPTAAAFVKGYLREMARLLDLDEEGLITGYMRRIR